MARKYTKREANYRPAEDLEMSCATCIFYKVVRGAGQCEVVAGIIEPNHTSDFWSPLSSR